VRDMVSGKDEEKGGKEWRWGWMEGIRRWRVLSTYFNGLRGID